MALSTGLWAADFPGHLNALMAPPQDREFIWINPANLNLADDSTGLEAGFAYGAGTGGFTVLLHFPAGVSAGFGLAQDRYVNYAGQARPYGSVGDYDYSLYGPGEEPAQFMAMGLAKRGFGEGTWLSGLSLGLDTRRYTDKEGRAYYYDSPGDRTYWSLDGGLAWDIPPWEGLGRLYLGVYALQTSTAFSADRLIGTQWQWLDESGIWDVEANLILSNPGLADQVTNAAPEQGSFPAHRLALSFHLGKFDLGGQILPANHMAAGPLFRWNIPTRSYLRWLTLSASAYFWSPGETVRAIGNVGIRATFHPPSAPYNSGSYAEYRQRKAVASAPTVSMPVDTGSVPPGVLEEADWEKRQAWYQDNKIGVWRGVVWPYVNTFGVVTTLFFPAGTSCLGVGDFGPGFALMGAWSAILAYNIIGDASTEARGTVYVVGQIGLKLTDLVLSQVFVHKYNRNLRERLRITALPLPKGSVFLAGLDF